MGRPENSISTIEAMHDLNGVTIWEVRHITGNSTVILPMVVGPIYSDGAYNFMASARDLRENASEIGLTRIYADGRLFWSPPPMDDCSAFFHTRDEATIWQIAIKMLMSNDDRWFFKRRECTHISTSRKNLGWSYKPFEKNLTPDE